MRDIGIDSTAQQSLEICKLHRGADILDFFFFLIGHNRNSMCLPIEIWLCIKEKEIVPAASVAATTCNMF